MLIRYAASHQHAILAAVWLEGTGTLLQVIFVLAPAHLAGTLCSLTTAYRGQARKQAPSLPLADLGQRMLKRSADGIVSCASEQS